jgi:hypothetical protein
MGPKLSVAGSTEKPILPLLVPPSVPLGLVVLPVVAAHFWSTHS